MKRSLLFATLAVAIMMNVAPASGAGSNVRLTNDFPGGGYVSSYTLATGQPYTDDVLAECSVARGRQNEPAVEIDPANPNVIIGSSNDYCGVYQPPGDPAPDPTGPIWLGYYRSQNGGVSFTSSLVPGYPGDTSPYASRAHIRTASSGDPVIAWDTHGRVFMGSESSDDPAGSPKSYGDQWVATYDNPTGTAPTRDLSKDGLRFVRSEIVARGSSAPGLLGKFHDKTAIEVDRTGGPGDGNVYFAEARYTGNGGASIYFARSTDHGATWSQLQKVSASVQDIQFPDISVTGNGHVYVTFRQFGTKSTPDAVIYTKSTDFGRSFSRTQVVTTFTPADAQDVAAPFAPAHPTSAPDDRDSEEAREAKGSVARDCGDFDAACQSGFTFFRRDTQVRSTADQHASNDNVYIVYDATKPSTVTSSTSTYSSAGPGKVGQSAIYFVRLDGATGAHTAPQLVDDPQTGHQIFPDIAVDQGVIHVLWWDSRNQQAPYSVQLPIGNNASRHVVPALDVYAKSKTVTATSWPTTAQPLTSVRSNPNYEQFSNRTVPFAGDYLWISAVGSNVYGVWTDWRNTVAGPDPRESTDPNNPAEPDEDADVLQCRTYDSATQTWSGDTCPHDGGVDQDIYGGTAP
jgi:hypothetical protein